jgi:hypothetical protein
MAVISSAQMSSLGVPSHAETDSDLLKSPSSLVASKPVQRDLSTPSPLARGAMSTYDRQTAWRHQGENVLSHSDVTMGSWLMKND